MGQQGGANAPYTRFRGPMLVGQSSDFGIAAVNGGSTAPLISFWNASEHGMYVVSSAETRQTVPGGAIMSYTSAMTRFISTFSHFAAAPAARITSTETYGFLIVPQTTQNMSSASVPTGTLGGAALVVEHLNTTGTAKLWVYSTISGWMGSTLAYDFTSTTTGN